MSSTSNINSLQRYFAARFREELLPKKTGHRPGPSVTISRETGAGGVSIGQKLAKYLEKNDRDRESVWGLFDRNLVDEVIQDYRLPEKMAKYIEEHSANAVEAYIGELLDLHPSISTLVEKMNETIRKLAKTGNAVLVGRGGNIITFPLKNTYHIRLTCPLEQRVKRIQSANTLDYKEATEYVRKKDRERAEYVRKNFDKNIADPLLYHLTLNTGLHSEDEAVRIIGEAVLQHAQSLAK